MSKPAVPKSTVHGLKAILTEVDGLQELAKNLTLDAQCFSDAVDAILNTKGRVIVCGMGKSGIVGKKIAASLASTGTPSFFMHPGEAFHGDLGMVHPDDIFLALSNSGETEEVLKLLSFLEGNKNTIISFTQSHTNTLARAANFSLRSGVSREACPLQLAPTASTPATMALGDALTVALLKARDFQPEDFARFHPGGSLGKKLLYKVEDVMVSEELPFVTTETDFGDIVWSMSRCKLGLALVGTSEDLKGIITDGDLRRCLQASVNEPIGNHIFDFMTKNPITVEKGTRFGDALDIMESNKVTRLIVVENNNVVGVVQK